jgi:xanthine dehydrogenase accessory factor
MSEDRQVLEALLQAQTNRRPVALAVIIRDQGSVPRHAGTKMLIYEDGQTVGTIGGGEMESRVIQAARDALADGRTRIVPYSLVDPQRGDPGVCGGNVEIYVEPYLSTWQHFTFWVAATSAGPWPRWVTGWVTGLLSGMIGLN